MKEKSLEAAEARITSIRRTTSLLRSELQHLNFMEKFASQFDALEREMTGLERVLANVVNEDDKFRQDQDEQDGETSKLSQEISLIATTYSKIALEEIDKRTAIPNQTEELQRHNSEIELLRTLANGYEAIARTVGDENTIESANAGLRAKRSLAEHLRNSITEWADKHGADSLQSALQIPIIALGIYALGIVGVPLFGAVAISGAVVAPDKLSTLMS